MVKVFLDCDGVLADFDGHCEAVFGEKPVREEGETKDRLKAQMRAHGSFYRDLPLKSDAMRLYEALAHANPVILTGCPEGGWAEPQKVAWAAEHFPGVPILTCRSSQKYKHARHYSLLIDDYLKYAGLWRDAGGIFLHHKDTERTLATLITYEAMFSLGIWPMPKFNEKPIARRLYEELGVAAETIQSVRREMFCAALL